MRRSVIRRKLGRVDHAIDKAIGQAEIPGAVVLARMPREGEELEHLSQRGLAVIRPERIPMGRETIFDLASLTKPIATTSAILHLVNDCAMGLEDPVARFLPAFAEREKEAVRNSGVLRYWCEGSNCYKSSERRAVLLYRKERMWETIF